MKAVNHHDEIIETWKTKDSKDFGYYSRFEAPERVAWFWSPASRFRQAFEKYLDLSNVLEVASGVGRHASQIVDRCGHLTLLDTSIDATTAAKERFQNARNVTVVLSEDGLSLPFEDGCLSAAFSYDAMVHFEPLTMASYISELSRVLRPGARAILHHSNYSGNPTGKFTENPSWRNYMPEGFVAHVASRSGLVIVEQQCFKWHDNKQWFAPKTDAMTVLERPT